MIEVNVDWGDIEKNIVKTVADLNGPVRRKAGKEAGFKLGEALEGNTPVDPSTGKKLLKDTVVVGAVQENGKVDVGYGKGAYHRAHLVNMGTESQKGQHFIEKTVEKESRIVMDEYMKTVRDILK